MKGLRSLNVRLLSAFFSTTFGLYFPPQGEYQNSQIAFVRLFLSVQQLILRLWSLFNTITCYYLVNPSRKKLAFSINEHLNSSFILWPVSCSGAAADHHCSDLGLSHCLAIWWEHPVQVWSQRQPKTYVSEMSCFQWVNSPQKIVNCSPLCCSKTTFIQLRKTQITSDFWKSVHPKLRRIKMFIKRS